MAFIAVVRDADRTTPPTGITRPLVSGVATDRSTGLRPDGGEEDGNRQFRF
jgi:hypothetical protein